LKDRDIFLDLSARVKLRVAGNDRLRYLNGQVTADARKATTSGAIEACLLDAKGRMNAHVFLFAPLDCFLLDADPALKETLQARLERYIIADDVLVEDISERLSIFHVVSETAPAFPTAKWIVLARRFARSGWDIWVDSSEHERAAQQLSDAFSFCDPECAEIFRIEQGIPRWGRELTNEIIPVEANLEERALDYEKGCYVGQEVISRMKMSGQRNKRLCGLISADNRALSLGMKLVAAPSGGEKNVGWITSATRSAKLGKEIALGYVRRGFDSMGKLWITNVGDQESQVVEVVIVDLPFGP
jgi:folate-binding protein YgfZ